MFSDLYTIPLSASCSVSGIVELLPVPLVKEGKCYDKV